jgi:hypothetical protein
MKAEERLTDLFRELDRQTTVPPHLEARIAAATDARRRLPVFRLVAAVAAAVIALAALPLLFSGEGSEVVETRPLATARPEVFDAQVTSSCTATARAMTAVGPRFTTAAAYDAARIGIDEATGPVIAALVAALPPRDDVSLPSRVVAGLRAGEAHASVASRVAHEGDIAAAGESFAAAVRQIDESLRELVAHGARCSVIGTED